MGYRRGDMFRNPPWWTGAPGWRRFKSSQYAGSRMTPDTVTAWLARAAQANTSSNLISARCVPVSTASG